MIMATEEGKQPDGSDTVTEEILADNRVLIVGGGPVGLLTAVVLAFYGVPSVIVERNADTTRSSRVHNRIHHCLYLKERGS